MKALLDDKAFVLTILATLILTALVFTDKASVDVLLGWLGGAVGPTVGRLKKGSPESLR